MTYSCTTNELVHTQQMKVLRANSIKKITLMMDKCYITQKAISLTYFFSFHSFITGRQHIFLFSWSSRLLGGWRYIWLLIFVVFNVVSFPLKIPKNSPKKSFFAILLHHCIEEQSRPCICSWLLQQHKHYCEKRKFWMTFLYIFWLESMQLFIIKN